MMFVIGIVLFALAILVSVALHECGHMWVARATGMKVRRYFVGFGSTLWSTRRPNKLGSTEYGVKAIPLGGFCDIAGMTSVEELKPDEAPYAMYRQKVWKRVAVLFAGPAMNFIIGLVLIYAIAMMWGLPNLHPDTRAVIGETACVTPQVARISSPSATDSGPACGQAGIQPGDMVVKVGDKDVSDFTSWSPQSASTPGPPRSSWSATEPAMTVIVDVAPTQRWVENNDTPSTVGAIGVGPHSSGRRSTTRSRRCRLHSRSPATSPSSWARRW